MSEIDEIRFNNLENRVTKIEEYIKCSEEAKEQEWREWGASVDKKLEAIGNRQIRTAWQWPMAFGVMGAAIGYNFLVTGADRTASIILICIGLLLAIIALFAVRCRVKKCKR